ncbi:MAG TPA: prolyl oligopeptidase family serine peptidase [Frankiaceae bacterium]|nr:prolyl oligopeptidase family serine peptidase [Frankiaceae bacterium]
MVVLVLAALASVTVSAPARAATVERYSIVVQGETALGWAAYPASATPTKLLVFGHGCCGNPNQSALVRRYADDFGAVAVAMDYRGPGHFDVMKGHQDVVAATEELKTRFPSITRTVIWGQSMGGTVTGRAVAARPDLYDYWVDTFGAVDLFQQFTLFAGYPAITPNPDDPDNPTGSWLIEECGGTPATAPQAYLDRSPAYQANRMKGLKRVYIAHGIGDLVVQYSQSRLMHANLVANGIPATMTTVLTRSGGIQGPLVPGQQWPTVPTPYGPSAHDGSATKESSAVVNALLRGLEPDAGTATREWVVDGTTGQRVSTP